MKKKTLIGIAIALLLVLITVSVGYGLFSAVAKSKENRLQSGKVAVELSGEPVTLNNIQPGDRGEVFFEIKNTGTLPVVYTVNFETSGKLFEGNSAVVLFGFEGKYLDVGETQHIPISWYFPEEAGDSYQGASGTFVVVVNAQQATNGYP